MLVKHTVGSLMKIEVECLSVRNALEPRSYDVRSASER